MPDLTDDQREALRKSPMDPDRYAALAALGTRARPIRDSVQAITDMEADRDRARREAEAIEAARVVEVGRRRAEDDLIGGAA